ncbi:MAG: phage holin family protein [Firmicutes bacterium]|nr:phage holin family protein [Bacillota bacterium]
MSVPVYQEYYSASYRRRSWVIRWLVTAIALLVTAAIVPGVGVDSVFAALFAAAAIGIVNAFVRPVFLFLTLPINFLTLGLFTFVLNGLMLALAAFFVPGFHVSGFFSAVFGALLLGIVSSIINRIARA